MKHQRDSNKLKLMIYAIHPVMYQTPIFSEFNNYKKSKMPWLDFKVYFGSDISLKETYFSAFQSSYKSDFDDLLDGFEYEFLKNFAIDERSGFFSRINFGVIRKIIFGNYDVILFHGYDTITSLFILITSVLFRKKIIFRGESILRGDESSKRVKNFLKKIYLQAFFYFCHKILYSCSGNKEFFMHYGVKSTKLGYIPCAVNNNFFQDQINKNKLSKKIIKKNIGIKDDDLVLAMCCSFTKRKRPTDLITAVKKLDTSKNIFLLFIGDGPERSTIELSLKNTGIRYYITGFLGQNEISKYYIVSDISLVLSDYDPSPKALNEAMNFSNCIIATKNVGTSDDLIKNNINGYIINAGDIGALSKIINYLNKDRERIQTMGSKSLKIVSEFNYTKDAESIAEAILEIAK